MISSSSSAGPGAMTVIHSYSYKPKFHLALLALCAFLACAAVGIYATIHEDREVVISSLINLGPGGSKLFFILLALGSFWLVVQATMAIRASLMPDRCIVLASDHIAIPASLFSREASHIPFADITGLSLQTDKRSRILHIRHGAGTTKATQRFFDDPEQFEAFLAQLQTAIRG